jgi:hypothetical protein
MASEFVAVAIWLFAAFAAGAASGLVLAQAVSIHLETRLGGPPGGLFQDVALGARGLTVRGRNTAPAPRRRSGGRWPS